MKEEKGEAMDIYSLKKKNKQLIQSALRTTRLLCAIESIVNPRTE